MSCNGVSFDGQVAGHGGGSEGMVQCGGFVGDSGTGAVAASRTGERIEAAFSEYFRLVGSFASVDGGARDDGFDYKHGYARVVEVFASYVESSIKPGGGAVGDGFSYERGNVSVEDGVYGDSVVGLGCLGGVAVGGIDRGGGGSSDVVDGTASIARPGLVYEVPRGWKPMVRGPNYERNKENRARKKENKSKGFQSGNWRAVEDPHADLASEVRLMRLERQKIQEKRKLDKLNSPTQIIEDAMKMVKLAEGYARKANDNKVAAWAASLSQSSAESIAKSGGSLPSVESVVASRALEAKQAKLGFSALPMNAVESAAVREKVMTAKQVLDARFKCDRVIKMADFEREDFPYAMSSFQARRIATAAYS